MTDYKYYNVLLKNKTDKPIAANYSERRTMPILEKMEDYEISMIRWKVPSWNIPLFRWTKDTFIVRLEAQGGVYEQKVTVPDGQEDIYYYDHFIRFVNDALSAAFAALILVVAAYNNSTRAPQIIYDPETKLFAVVTKKMRVGDINHSIWSPTSEANPITLLFNQPLISLFSAFPNEPRSDGWYGVNILDTLSNKFPRDRFTSDIDPPDGGYTITKGNYPCLFAWHKLTRILVVTTMPIETEDVGQKTSASTNEGIPVNYAILTDFEVIQGEQEVRDYIYYFTTNDKRYVNFTGTGALKEVNMSIYWDSEDLDYQQLMIPPGKECYIKLQFKKKNAG